MVIRLVLILLITCIVAVGAARLVGSLATTEIAIDYYEIEGETYTLYVRDTVRDSRLWLAGTRCFDVLPDWLISGSTEEVMGMSNYGQPRIQRAIDAADAIKRLWCR